MITPGTYYSEYKKPKRRFAPSAATKAMVGNFCLFFPAVWFWISVLLKVTLGSDYFYDVVFDTWRLSFLGNLVLIFVVIGMPGLSAGINALVYKHKRERIALWMMITGTVLFAVGIFAVVRKV